MIDIQHETVLSLTEASRLAFLPRRRRGKRPHVATLYRWAKQGVRGVRLETIRCGGTLGTSIEAIQRFFQRLSDEDNASLSMPTRAQSARDVEQRLSEFGL